MKRGFTLLEMMVTVVVAGILVAMAIPNYERAVQIERWRTARDILMTIYYGQRTHLFASSTTPQTYCDVTGGANGCTPGGPVPCWSDIAMDNPNTSSIPIRFTSTSAFPFTTFTGTAVNMAGGRCAGRILTVTIDVNGLKQFSGPAGNAWGNETTCLKQDGFCC